MCIYRYELLEELPIQSIYPTTYTIYQAMDHLNDKQLVQLMFMKDQYYYYKEIEYYTNPITLTWIKNSKYILNLIDFYSIDENQYIFEELKLFNIQTYSYLLVYPLPSFNLQEYMLRLHYKLEDIKKIIYEICQCLYYIHEKGINILLTYTLYILFMCVYLSLSSYLIYRFMYININ